MPLFSLLYCDHYIFVAAIVAISQHFIAILTLLIIVTNILYTFTYGLTLFCSIALNDLVRMGKVRYIGASSMYLSTHICIYAHAHMRCLRTTHRIRAHYINMLASTAHAHKYMRNYTSTRQITCAHQIRTLASST